MPSHNEIKEAAEADLVKFIRLVAPQRVLGNVHKELIRWWNREDAKTHQLILLPRGHQKSAMIAYRVAWEITRNPSTSILYLSATSPLANEQLGAIKNILTSPRYRKFWPEMVNQKEGQRARWTTNEIKVDHPTRKEEGVRDPTVFTGGLTTSLTGYHCDIAVLDDVVVQENAYTEEGREKVRTQYSLLSSIENPGAKEWAVGTRYHPNDLYNDLMQMREDIFDSEGNVVYQQQIYEVFQREVEDNGDGTGEFLWPREQRDDGQWFGFNTQILMTKKAQYLDKMQYWAQYYNNPNDPENRRIDESRFQYFDANHLQRIDGKWFINGRALNLYAAIDLAYTKKAKSDFSVIVVIGIDRDKNIYVLDISRFQTDKISKYFEEIERMHVKWDVRKLRAETTGAQSTVVKELKDQYIKPAGLVLSIDEYYPTRHEGTKEERISATLEPRYENLMVWHYQGGNIQALEQELSLANPPHDDIKDALASAVQIATPPLHADRSAGSTGHSSQTQRRIEQGIYHPRFGGVAR
jgi:phage terminase large subunit-like protein